MTDNVPFNSLEFKTFCVDINIKFSFISLKHSHSNRMVKNRFGFLNKCLKKLNMMIINYGITYWNTKKVQLKALNYLHLNISIID